MRQPPHELVVDDVIGRLPAGAGFLVALVMSVPVYVALALLF